VAKMKMSKLVAVIGLIILVGTIAFSSYACVAWGSAAVDVAQNGNGDFQPYNKYSLVRDNPDGTQTMRIYPDPINYRDEASGRWQPIDTTIVNLGDIYGVETGVYKAYFYSDHAEVVREGGSVVEIYFLGTSDPGHTGPMTLSVESNRAIYNGNIDLEYIYTDTGLKQNVVLYEKPEADGEYFVVNTKLVFDQPVYADAEHFTTSEAVEFKNAAGDVIYRLPRPFAFELDNFADQVDCEYEITVSGSEALVSIKTPGSWLEDSAYPVVIDPTSTYYSTTTLDGYLTYRDGVYDAVDAGSSTMSVGNANGPGTGKEYIYRSYVSFDTSGIGANTVVSAQLAIKVAADNSTNRELQNQVYNVSYSGDAALTSADWDVYSSGTLEGVILDTTGGVTVGNYYTLWVGQMGVNTGGNTDYSIKSNNEATLADNTEAYIDWYTADQTGTTDDPYLEVTYGTVTWVSYRDSGRSQAEDNFVDPYRTAYMGGAGFTASHSYHVGYYDGVNVLVLSEGVSSDGSGNLQSTCGFEDKGAIAGTWHSVVYDDDVASPPSTYTASDSNSVFEDSFTVNESAIPEFPTIMAMISVTALCGAIYCWMRKRRRIRT